MIRHSPAPAGFRFPSRRLTEADFQRLDRVREAMFEKARRTVDPEGTGFDLTASDDSSFFSLTDGDPFADWRDRMIDVISIASRRVSLAILSVGFAIAGAWIVSAGVNSRYGSASLIASGVFAIWGAGANVFGSRASR